MTVQYPEDDVRPCIDKPQLFDSIFPDDHTKAKAICADCPLTDWCIKWREETEIPEGTWHGVLFRDGQRIWHCNDCHRELHKANRYCLKCAQKRNNINHTRMAEWEAKAEAAEGTRGSGQLKKTHCKQGHPYNELNTYIDARRGWRECRICRADRRKDQYAREKANR